MTDEHASHATQIEASAPSEVAVGTGFELAVRVGCPAGCDLAGLPFLIQAPDGATATTEPDPAGEAVRTVPLTAPLAAGEHVWRISVAQQEIGGFRHRGGELTVSVITRPHETSLAVWAIPSPVVTGRRFTIKAGAKCAANCTLAGRTIEVRNERGAVLASGRLGAAPWPGTTALYWTEFELLAPAEHGLLSWAIAFDPAGLAVEHDGAAASFSIAIANPPEHKLVVKVFERETAAPIVGAQLRLGTYRAETGPGGVAEILMPKGVFELNVWKVGYEAPSFPITMDRDVAIEVAVTPLPEEDPDAAWLM
jgi:hypothetical protein